MLPPSPSAADGSNGAGWENALGRNPSRIVFLGFNLMTHEPHDACSQRLVASAALTL
jgi:hypothetical protein